MTIRYGRASNFVLFQLGWFVTVYLASIQRPTNAVIAASLLISLHLYFSHQRRHESALLVCAGILGFIIDSLNLQLGVFVLSHQITEHVVAPLWLVGLWILFAGTLNHSLTWLLGKPYLASLLAAIAGPFAYFAGAKMEVLSLSGVGSFFIIALQWAAVLPIMLIIQDKFARITPNMNLKSRACK